MRRRDPDDPRRKVAGAAAAGVAVSVLALGLMTWMAVDVDSDGASTYQEVREGTAPMKGDTDGDGVADGWEMENGYNALAASSAPEVRSVPVDSNDACQKVVLLVGDCDSGAGSEGSDPAAAPPPSGGSGAGWTSLIGASTVSLAITVGRLTHKWVAH